ncbi:MAG: tRNA pseudouridine(55) synthase TruB [Alphaproteobacteria bacterium]
MSEKKSKQQKRVPRIPVHGWVIIDKPAGVSSTQVVGKVRRALNAEKAGHGGTLDPAATGLLPIALGEATKTVPFVMDGRKTYRFVVAWGEARATDDAEGEVVATSAVRPSRAEIEAALAQFIGRIDQMPPAYSALKIDGARAYDLARAGGVPALKSRPVEVYRFELIGTLGPDHAVFEVDCGKGTYVRSLGRDLAVCLGTRGYVAGLRRTRVGRFTEADAISLDNFISLSYTTGANPPLLAVATALDDIPALALDPGDAARLKHGQSVRTLPPYGGELGHWPAGATGAAFSGTTLVALVRIDGDTIVPLRVFNL